MLNRKLLVGCSILCFSTAVLASGGMTYTKMADQKAGWSLGVEALYWQPSNGDLTYALVADKQSWLMGETPVDGNTFEVDPDYDWGFKVIGQYYFTGAKNSILASYTRFRTDAKDSVSVENCDYRVWSTIIHPDVNDERGTWASAKADFDYDSFDVMFGQVMNPQGKLNLEVAAGVRYSDLGVKMNALYRTPEGSSDSDYEFQEDGTEITVESSYKGIGPRLAAFGSCDLGGGIGVVANVGTSLLIGDLKASHMQYDHDNSEKYFDEVQVKKEPRHVVVEVDADLGLTYTYAMQSDYTLTLGAGWRVMTYAEGRNRLQFHDENAGALANNLTNMSFNGPYVGLHISTV
jgi:hypothetical protein